MEGTHGINEQKSHSKNSHAVQAPREKGWIKGDQCIEDFTVTMLKVSNI